LTWNSYDGDDDNVAPAVATKAEEFVAPADATAQAHPEPAVASTNTNYADYDDSQNDLQQQMHANDGMEHMMDDGQHNGSYNNDAQPEERLIGMKEDG
jgi:hypothetical protein